jgi:hypothetical protein
MSLASVPIWMTYANFVVGVATLFVLVWYACLTRGIERASVEQSEGLSRPVVTPVIRARRPLSERAGTDCGGAAGQRLEDVAKERYSYAAELHGDHLILENIGNGPALHVKCWIEFPNGESEQGPYFVPYLRSGKPHDIFDAPVPHPYHSERGTICCMYYGINGRKHSSKLPFIQGGATGAIEVDTG